jgi:hypothetical protein
MRLPKEEVTYYRFAQPGGGTAGETFSTNGLNFEVFGAKEIRDLLKNKAHCLRAGFPPNHILIAILNEIRDRYILRVGLPTYLSQMLGKLSTARVDHCTLYSEGWHPIKINLRGNHNQPLLRFLAKQFGWDNLPFMVEVRGEADPNQVQVRYL